MMARITCSYYHPLINIIQNIVVLLTKYLYIFNYFILFQSQISQMCIIMINWIYYCFSAKENTIKHRSQ